MADFEKTLKGLNCCKNSYPKDCTHCPYEKDRTHHETCDILIRNAISVILEQQAKIKKYELDKSWEDSPDRMNGSGW